MLVLGVAPEEVVHGHDGGEEIAVLNAGHPAGEELFVVCSTGREGFGAALKTILPKVSGLGFLDAPEQLSQNL